MISKTKRVAVADVNPLDHFPTPGVPPTMPVIPIPCPLCTRPTRQSLTVVNERVCTWCGAIFDADLHLVNKAGEV